jgi:predicted pyridoxine 5'-phosphate oxidase superfamily flavin-nucleotide-binding protein
LAKQFPRIEEPHREFIERQHIFFNSSAAAEGHVNVSPRDRKSLRVLDDRTVVYLDLTGSGNETAAHLRANGRLTLMFCSFEGAPLILRLYGTGRVIRRDSDEYAALLRAHYEGIEPLGARQIVMLTVELVQTSCGYGVPLFDYRGERDTLTRWTQAKGVEGLEAYWREKNQCSIDGFPTGLLEHEPVDTVS